MSHACKPISQVLFTHPAQLSVLENAARNMHAYNQGVYNMHVLMSEYQSIQGAKRGQSEIHTL